MVGILARGRAVIADNRPTNVYSYDRMVIYINGVEVTADWATMVRDAIESRPPYRAPRDPFEDELRDFRTAVERRRDEIRAWTREALLSRSAAERVCRARDPSQRESGEFRIRVRACGSAWRTTLR